MEKRIMTSRRSRGQKIEIMNAIEFSMDVEKVPDPKGDRVKITMNGKFPGYKTC